MTKKSDQYIISAKVCDDVIIDNKPQRACQTIKSIPLSKSKAKQIQKKAKAKVPTADIQITKA